MEGVVSSIGPCELTEYIGSGTFANVFAGYMRKSGRHVAVKIFKDDTDPCSFELTNLRKLCHPNIVQVLGVVVRAGSKQSALITELMECPLSEILSGTLQRLDTSVVQSYTRQMLEAIEYCHLVDVVHRDLKCSNVLVSGDRCTVKLSDFGSAGPVTEVTAECVTTLISRAPELLVLDENVCPGISYSKASDIWALGTIVARMALAWSLFSDVCDYGLATSMVCTIGSANFSLWPRGHWFMKKLSQVKLSHGAIPPSDNWTLAEAATEGLLGKLMAPSPTRRMSAHEALMHPFLAH
jgi:serine/threonine protein kinase